MVITNFSGETSKKKKQTQGRKKIEIKKIQETNSLLVTFSKRRTGLFKKIAELCVLTGVEVAILVHSPGGKVYTFGHSNTDVIIDRYLNNGDQNYVTPPLFPVDEFNRHYDLVSKELELEKQKMVLNSGGGRRRWYEDDDIDGMDVMQLEEYLYSLIELKKKVVTRAHEVMILNNTAPALGSGDGLNDVVNGQLDFFYGGGVGRFN
ncbi:agamous-like MADS-box protein AGL62 [Rutidosis leptorrhynchoides]|uniref:agamous-like MADS-box protein AGL62 n=1 Tax=Rutidosis leptorrhynchoides TaxID=125765 RepID=UPI003A996474